MIWQLFPLALSGILAIWLQVGLSPLLAQVGLPVNWLLLLALVVTFSGKRTTVFFALGMGLCHDALTHGVVGIYGLSYFLTALFARSLNRWFYTNQLLFLCITVALLSAVERLLAMTLFLWGEPELLPLRWDLLLTKTLLAQAVAGSLVIPMFMRYEKRILSKAAT